MTTRDELIDYVLERFSELDLTHSQAERLADWHISTCKHIVEPLVNKLEDIHNALDISLGDTDPDFPEEMTDEEIMEEEPVFWACKEVALLSNSLKLAGIEDSNEKT